MSKAPDWTLVRKIAEELRTKILSKFPTVDVEYVDWEELTGKNASLLEHRGFPWPRGDVHAYMLIRGDLETAEKAATLADNEVGRIWEEAEIIIQVQKTNHVWCKKSGMLVAQRVEPGQELTGGPSLYYHQDKRGIDFWCWMRENHEHDWGNVVPQE